MPRPPKKDAVIPTTSMVASAVRYSGKAARIYQPRQDWQAECYRHYGICGEARYAANFYGNALSRATLFVGKRGAKGIDPVTTGSGIDALTDLFNGKDGQAQMLKAIGTHLTIAGECYLVGRQVSAEEEGEVLEDGDIWEVVSVLEMKVTGTKWSIQYGQGLKPIELTDDDVVIRIWDPNPAQRMEADSPFRSLLPILAEIEWLTRHIFAQTSSRLAGAGLLLLPNDMSFPKAPAVEGEEVQPQGQADEFMLTLGENMLTPIKDPSSPAAMIPIVAMASSEGIKNARLMHFWSDLDKESGKMRQEAIGRFALGMDLPPEEILGMSSNGGTGGGTSNGVSHWGAWQIEESTIKMHVEPKLELIANALTMGYLRPLTGNADEVVSSDTSALRLRPDRSRESIELGNLGLLKNEVIVRENGFDPTTDMKDDSEFRTWLITKVASGSATPEQVAAALSLLGIDLPTAAPNAVPGEDTRESRPAPSLEDHPVRPRTPEETPAALVAACDALVYRALERAGNRIRQNAGVRRPGVASYDTHVVLTVNGTADEVLDDAWACAPQVLSGAGISDVEGTVQSLNSYVKGLFADQVSHTRARLESHLEHR